MPLHWGCLMASPRSGLMAGWNLPVPGVLLGLVIVCCLGAGCMFFPGFPGQDSGIPGHFPGIAEPTLCYPFYAPEITCLGKYYPAPPSGWKITDTGCLGKVYSYNLPTNEEAESGMGSYHEICMKKKCAIVVVGIWGSTFTQPEMANIIPQNPALTPNTQIKGLPARQNRNTIDDTTYVFVPNKEGKNFAMVTVGSDRSLDTGGPNGEPDDQDKTDMFLNLIDYQGISQCPYIDSCKSPKEFEQRVSAPYCSPNPVVTSTCTPSAAGQQNPEDPRCKTQKDKLILALMLRNAFASPALRELAYNSEADGNQYNLAATKLATQMRDTLKNTPDDNPVCRSDYDRAVEVYNQVSSGASSPFMDSVFQDSQAELIKALTADLTQQSSESQAQSAGLSIGGTTDANCEFITNPSMDPAVEAHESAHIRYCQGHGKLNDMSEDMAGEGGVLDYIHGTETYAYDAEIAYRMSELSSSGCQ